jgi:putative drug exporter of the RND superfamily
MRAANIPANAGRPGPADRPGPLAPRPAAQARTAITERLAAACSRRRWRTVAAWGGAVVAALVLTVTMLHGLTTSGYVIGTTPSAQAGVLYTRALGGAAAHQPTDVIVLSSRSATVADARFRAAASQLANRVAAMPGVASVRPGLRRGSLLVSANGHAALIDLRVASDSGIEPVVQAVRAANGRDGIAVAVTGTHTLGNDLSTMSSNDLRRGEIDFGLPIALVILILVFGAVVAGLTPGPWP